MKCLNIFMYKKKMRNFIQLINPYLNNHHSFSVVHLVSYDYDDDCLKLNSRHIFYFLLNFIVVVVVVIFIIVLSIFVSLIIFFNKLLTNYNSLSIFFILFFSFLFPFSLSSFLN